MGLPGSEGMPGLIGRPGGPGLPGPGGLPGGSGVKVCGFQYVTTVIVVVVIIIKFNKILAEQAHLAKSEQRPAYRAIYKVI